MATVLVVPRHVLGGAGQVPPSERVRVASIGVGGMGGGDVGTISRLGAEMIALCDVDATRAAGSFNNFSKARKYQDFRVMLEKEAKNIDAVTVSTPDHTHAVASMAAIRLGKHVYCQKPMTQTLYECREVTKAAAKAKVITSMGNQGHASEGSRLTNEWIRGGAIGAVREVHAWSDRAGRLWKQGIGRPKELPTIPNSLNWDLWLGPRKERPYHPAYAPHNWRGWWDFGTGALGDMGCHIIDHPIWALELGAPASVEARTTLDGSSIEGKPNFDTYPIASVIYFDFPAGRNRPPVKLTWYDGGLMPPAPREMPRGQKLPDNGVLYVGSKGVLYHSSHGGMPRILPESLQEEARKIPKTMERSPGHYEEWVQGCKSGKKPAAGFDYSGPMTETMLLGVLALRFPGTRLEWDSEALKVTNHEGAAEFVRVEARKGWEL
ncbi:MAG: Gfo/Idh/MocA family oxidoreductase [Gemmataceae bacterium]|nr:Gfo/Idh/MocA family oxidoreductase [Gemmataceae bacterium]